MYLSAFYRLDTGRLNSGMGIGQISWMQIEEYCDREQIFNYEQRQTAHYHIAHLDKVYLEFQNTKRTKANKAPTNGSKIKPSRGR